MSAQDFTYDWLRRRIAALPPDEGTFLSEVALAVEAGVSRTPVREALLRLEAEGWLRIMPRKGAFVAPISDAEVDAVMQARLLIEDWGVREVGPGRDQLVQELETLLDEQRRHRADTVTFLDLDRQFHAAIVGVAGNPILAAFYDSLRDRQLRTGARALMTGRQRVDQVLTEHQAIVEGLRGTDLDTAVQAVHEHLETTQTALRSAPVLPTSARAT